MPLRDKCIGQKRLHLADGVCLPPSGIGCSPASAWKIEFGLACSPADRNDFAFLPVALGWSTDRPRPFGRANKDAAPCLTYICQGNISYAMNERTTVRLPAELLKRAKRKAVAEGRTLTALIEEGLRQVVEEKKTIAKGKRKLPRISKATGGLLPGVDLTQMWKIYEMEDLEYVERMKHFK